MRNLLRFASKIASPLFPTGKLLKTKTPVFLPFYHVVSNKKLPYLLNYPVIDEQQFKKELDFYLRHFKPVTLSQLQNKPAPGTFHLTFDDGLKECAEIIAPILLQKGIPATFFINSGFVDNKALFHRYKASLLLSEMHTHPDREVDEYLRNNGIARNNILQTSFADRAILDHAAELLELDFNAFLKETQPYMSTGQIKHLATQGFTIGGHSHKHPEFWKIPEKKQLKHIKKSMKWVEINSNQPVKAFAFPYTDDGVSSSLIKRIHNEGICDLSFGTAGVKYDQIDGHFQRYPAEHSANFQLNIKAEFVYFKLRKVLGKATVKHP
ncbi:polysaccharide deacetylase family protein [uncultured Draconibacterium sp.]|uniref:polysaccharide deacetylase family protein n=1 Tax=uncultured Draconibacterium sp. TaxID=1573823 RepID=UPI003261345B